MKHKTLNERIVSDPVVLLGKHVIRGTHVPVYLIAGFVEADRTPEKIVDDYPDLTVEDVQAAVSYAADEAERTEARTLFPPNDSSDQPATGSLL